MIAFMMPEAEYNKKDLALIRYTSLAHSILSKFGIVIIFKRSKTLLNIIKNGDNANNPFFKVITRALNVDDDFVEPVFLLGGSYFVHADPKRSLIPRPCNLYTTFKYVFKRCMQISEGNVLISCGLTATVCLAQFILSYKFKAQMISLCQVFIRLAEASIQDSKEVIDIIAQEI